MLLAELVEASATVAATRSRRAKVEALAAVLRRAAGTSHSSAPDPPVLESDPVSDDRLAIAVSFLCGEPRQGRIGIGWAAVLGHCDTAALVASLRLEEVDDALKYLAALGGPGSVEARSAGLASLFCRATAPEQRFTITLLAGELRQGALESLVADAVGMASGTDVELVRRAWMLTGDLSTTAVLARRSGNAGLASVALRVGTPVRPMLAATSASVREAIGLAPGDTEADAARPWRVEWKLDGARIQAHRSGDRVWLFTRNLNDVTHRLPSVVQTVASLAAQTLVLDGEVIGLGPGERPERFQDTMAEFSSDLSGAALALRAFFFDVLHVDGRDLLDTPLHERIVELQRVAGPHQVPGVTTDDPAAAERFAAAALDAGHEGVVVKAIDAPYEAGRRGASWRKVKPVRTLDLVVLAAEWGHGRRQGWLSNLHLGARGEDGGFVMVGKTFKGLTDALLAWQTETLLAREVDRRDITVFVRPEIVVEIAVDGVQVSTRYPGGVALRFARVKRYRDDKSAADADSIEAVRSLLSGRA